jgi:Flp pilus assembly pilin Flp
MAAQTYDRPIPQYLGRDAARAAPDVPERTVSCGKDKLSDERTGSVLKLRVAVRKLAISQQPEAGQGLTEYALILGFTSVAAIAALVLLGGDISSMLSSVVGRL